jgi:hypothetical protein
MNPTLKAFSLGVAAGGVLVGIYLIAGLLGWFP